MSARATHPPTPSLTPVVESPMARAPLALPALLLLFAWGLSTAPPAAGQTSRATFVALVDEFPDLDARALVVRDRLRDVVVLRPSDATPETLAMALFVLARARNRDPSPDAGQMLPITGFTLTAELSVRRHSRMTQALARLERRPSTRVGTLGTGRWIRLAAR